MNFLKKLFGRDKPQKKFDNTILISLLNQYQLTQSDFNYQAVLAEFLNGSAFLLTPSINDQDTGGEWTTINKGSQLKLNGIFDLDGLKVLGVFTDEQALVNWAKKPTQYTALGTDTITDICKNMGITRLVINSDSPNMFVMERNLENIKTTIIEKETPVKVGTPQKPLSSKFINKVIINFKKVDTILEAYQYMQDMNGELSYVLGIKLSIVSDNSRRAVQTAINNAFENEKFDFPLDVMILETDDWLQTVRGIHNSLFYKK